MNFPKLTTGITFPNGKVPLVLFSGGVDSTYLLWWLLQHTPVDIITIEHGYLLASAEPEALAREKILKELRNMDGLYKVREHFHSSKTYEHVVSPNELQYAQLYHHFQYLTKFVNYSKHSEVHMGLCLGDSSATVHLTLPDFWKMQGRIFLNFMEDPPPLKLILAGTSKRAIISNLPENLFKLTWSCNSPNKRRNKYIQCGKCVSCFANKRALEDIAVAGEQQKQLEKSLSLRKDNDEVG